jgi:VIT1/CCC1 family predicted Fe2+/Mn2+ transporter
MFLKESLKVGFSFGLTSGAITTMGLMVGLYSGTHSYKAVFGGVLTIAIADALSDALGMHVHEESENVHTHKEIWESTFATFISKFLFALTFLIPIILLPMKYAILVSVLWGMNIVAFLSYRMAKEQGVKPLGIIVEHLLIAFAVVAITYAIGMWVNQWVV